MNHHLLVWIIQVVNLKKKKKQAITNAKNADIKNKLLSLRFMQTLSFRNQTGAYYAYKPYGIFCKGKGKSAHLYVI